MKKIYSHLSAITRLSLLITACMLMLTSGSASAAVTNQSLAVPMYEYPTIGSYWDDITGAGGSSLPFVIVNPGSGPGASVDATYTSEIAENTADGIRSIGYVHSNYQARNYQDVYDDIDDWYQMYPGISGIFIDLVTDGDADDVCYIAGLYNHVKNTHPNDLVILNPGTNISANYEPYGDIFMNAENNFATYQSSWNVMHPGWEDNPAYQNRFWHAVHTTDPSDLAAAITLTRNNNAGWVYITDDTMPNPYHVTPTYWNSEISSVGSLPASTIPNRGKTQLPSGCQELQVSAAAPTTATAAKQTTANTNITVSNASATYDVEPSTRVSFSLPTGVSFASGSGTGWSCNTGSGLCTYASTINATQSAGVLGVSFNAGCDYESGDVAGTLTNFAGNTDSFTIPLTKPADCAALAATTPGGSTTLADTGIPTGIASACAGGLGLAAVVVYSRRRSVHYRFYPLRNRAK